MKMVNKPKPDKGFTLVELLVALLISGILMATISSIFLMSQKIYTRGADISYKQKTITNVETELQNALSTAISVQILSQPQESADFNLGFKNGVCVEVIANQEYAIEQISEIDLMVTNGNSMAYKLIPKKNTSMSTLSGSIIINNINCPINEILSGDSEKYLVITCADGT